MNDADRDKREIDSIAAMTADEVRAGLRQFGLRPIEHLPSELARLMAAEERLHVLTTAAVEAREGVKRAPTVTPGGGATQKKLGSVTWAAQRLPFQWLKVSWGALAFTRVAAELVAALSVAVIISAFGVKAVGIHYARPIPEPIFEKVKLINFPPAEEKSLLDAMRPQFTSQCTIAFSNAGLRSPSEIAEHEGIVIRPFSDLWLYSADSLGLVSDKTRLAYQIEFSSGRAQAGTVPATLRGVPLTVDGRPRIFLHGTAFYESSFWFKRDPLSVVLLHEFIHAGGQPPMRGWFFQHD
jgi:hypothetical protein